MNNNSLQILISKYPNLHHYCDRITKKFFKNVHLSKPNFASSSNEEINFKVENLHKKELENTNYYAWLTSAGAVLSFFSFYNILIPYLTSKEEKIKENLF